MHLPLSIALTYSGHNGVFCFFLQVGTCSLYTCVRVRVRVHVRACVFGWCEGGRGGGGERLKYGELWRHYNKGLVLLLVERRYYRDIK